MKNTLVPGKLYEVCINHQTTLILGVVHSPSEINLKDGEVILYLGQGDLLNQNNNIGVKPGYYTDQAQFFLIEKEVYVVNIFSIIPSVKII
jgi:hypothetical protein